MNHMDHVTKLHIFRNNSQLKRDIDLKFWEVKYVKGTKISLYCPKFV